MQTVTYQKKSKENVKQEVIKSFDAFAGVGGFTQALEACGIETVGFSEIDKYASAVLKYKYPNILNYGDITKIKPSDLPDFDLFTFGSPCQDFSIAGKRAGIDGGRSGLLLTALEIIKEKKPRYFLFENVKGMLSSNKGWDMARTLIEMEKIGYSLWWQVLNAKDFGVPQNRERIFVVGSRNGSPREILFERGTDKETVVANTIRTGGKGSLSKKHAWDLVQINQPKHSNDRVYSEEGIGPTLNTMQGGRRQPFVARAVLTPDRVEKRQNGRRMKEDGEPSFTLTSQDKHGVFTGTRVRRLTVVECERLMGWHSTAFYAKISLCLDQANNFVNAVNKNPKLRGLVLNVENEPESQLAKAVAKILSQSALLNESSVGESVTTNGQEVNKIHQSKIEKT